MTLSTFGIERTVKFTLMSQMERNIEITNRLIRIKELQELQEQNLSTWGETKTLKEEVDGLTTISKLILEIQLNDLKNK